MAKIETADAWKDIDSDSDVADAIMVARGDLGPAVEFIHLPEAQEELVAAARRAGKPVVVATQILEYFAEAGVPQRSELSGLSLARPARPGCHHAGKRDRFQSASDRVHQPGPRRAGLRNLPLASRRAGVCREVWRRRHGSPLCRGDRRPQRRRARRILCTLLGERLGLAHASRRAGRLGRFAAEAPHDPRCRLAGFGHVFSLRRDRIIARSGRRTKANCR